MDDRRHAGLKGNRNAAAKACVLAVLVFATPAFPQSGPVQTVSAPRALTGSTPAISDSTAPIPRGVTYSGGQLTIDALNVTLLEVLNKVASLTGIKIDLPIEANAERIPMVRLGPGPARLILAALLRDTHFNFLIAASEKDPEKLQSVLILPMDPKAGEPAGRSAGPTPSPYATASPSLEPVAKSESSQGIDRAAQVADNARTQPASTDPNASGSAMPSGPDAPSAALSAASASSDGARAGALSPPPVLNQQSISQQLQDMYQQRAQMLQQGRPPARGGN